jgi:hypothetical protein
MTTAQPASAAVQRTRVEAKPGMVILRRCKAPAIAIRVDDGNLGDFSVTELGRGRQFAALRRAPW